jgi:hypothetical protein
MYAGENVYVNVTWGYLKYIDKGKCLCECYMSLFERYQKWKMFMWMLHEFVQKISTRENVYVNVTWVYLKDIDWGKCLCKYYMSLFKRYQKWKCLCKCYMSLFKIYRVGKMFMWMLHEFVWKILTGENVYVNVTWVCLKDIDWGKCLCECYMSLFKRYEQWKMFMWMLHEFICMILIGENVYVNVTWVYLKDIDKGKCLCNCYMRLFKRYRVGKMFMWMIHEFAQIISARENVYVNVTRDCSKYMNSGKCLFKCYMSLFKICEQWTMFMWMLHFYMRLFERYWLGKMFMWMLHEFVWKILTGENVYVNVTWVCSNDIDKGKMFMWMLHEFI